MTTPELSVYTPTYKRPAFLDANVESIRSQTVYNKIDHVVVVDRKGLGVGGMFAAISENAHKVVGKYVLILSDDNCLADTRAAEELLDFIARQNYPDVVVWKGVAAGHPMPTSNVWENRPRFGEIDLSNFIVRTDVWQGNLGYWKDDYSADFYFIEALYRDGHRFTWLNRIGYYALAVMRGATEEQWWDAGCPEIMSHAWRQEADRRSQQRGCS